LIGSSDTHTSRAGSGYKEVYRLDMTDARMARLALSLGASEEPLSSAEAVDLTNRPPFAAAELTRLGSHFYTGGLVALHAQNRSRDAVWDALMKRHVYGTSGPRILLYFELLAPEGNETIARMGDEVTMLSNPRFRVRAAGSFEQLPGCPDDAVQGLSPERLERLCRGECANPSDTRRAITRIEVVRIRPQLSPDESLDLLIDDPWQTLAMLGTVSTTYVQSRRPSSRSTVGAYAASETKGGSASKRVRATKSTIQTIVSKKSSPAHGLRQSLWITARKHD